MALDFGHLTPKGSSYLGRALWKPYLVRVIDDLIVAVAVTCCIFKAIGMPDLPFDPPKEAPRRGPAAVAASDNGATQRYSHRDILAMYPSLRLDHLRYLEKCGLVKPRDSEQRALLWLRRSHGAPPDRRRAAAGRDVPRGRPHAAVVADRPAGVRFPSRRASGANHRAEAAHAGAARQPNPAPRAPSPLAPQAPLAPLAPACSAPSSAGRTVFPDGIAAGRWDAGADGGGGQGLPPRPRTRIRISSRR